MGSKVTVPGPSAEERELQKQQAETLKLQREILEEQRRQNAVLLPFLADQEGYSVETDANGNITRIFEKDNKLKKMKLELEEGLTERSLKALKGELPVDPALENALVRQERDLRAGLSGRFGPGYETSSPAIETLGDFFKHAEELRAGARNAQLSLAEQLSITREQQRIYAQQTSQDSLQQVSQQVPLTLAGGFGQNARGFGAAQQPYIQQRQMQLQASIANAQSKASMFGAGLGAIGSIIGAFSDEAVKENLQVIGMYEDRVPIYRFRYLGELTERIGMLAQDLLRYKPEAVFEREGLLVVNYEAL